ncbi:hypothetical protein MHIR_DE00665 [Candidatus Doolittlea endobia]|uniref:Uncharacterized protein n=1 Tax=Candidatus Doolittlea endobia TaxID=1778262 RepID=A0A143WSU1_9ENTR|nr:hypothetical protein MHIR_DE00665 [Candidatus Doolittlea endobia]
MDALSARLWLQYRKLKTNMFPAFRGAILIVVIDGSVDQKLEVSVKACHQKTQHRKQYL